MHGCSVAVHVAWCLDCRSSAASELQSQSLVQAYIVESKLLTKHTQCRIPNPYIGSRNVGLMEPHRIIILYKGVDIDNIIYRCMHDNQEKHCKVHDL